MKTPFLHLARRLTTATPAGWFPACLHEATGYATAPEPAAVQLPALASREERLRPRHLAACGALFAAPGGQPLGGVVVLPASDGLSPVTVADDLRARLAAGGRALLDAALADPRLLAHLDIGAPAGSLAGIAALQFLRDRHAYAVGHFLRGPAAADAGFDATSVCIQLAGLPAPLVLWLAAAIAAESGAVQALVLTEEDGARTLLERQRPLHVLVH